MKLRLTDNSVRLRLSRSEVDQFLETGLIEETIEFPNTPLVYMLHASSQCRQIQAAFVNGWITVTVPENLGRDWAAGDQVAMRAADSNLSILIEKDWQCLHASKEENEDAFPRP